LLYIDKAVTYSKEEGLTVAQRMERFDWLVTAEASLDQQEKGAGKSGYYDVFRLVEKFKGFKGLRFDRSALISLDLIHTINIDLEDSIYVYEKVPQRAG